MELATLVRELQIQIALLGNQQPIGRSMGPKSSSATQRGIFSVAEKPSGVSLILSNDVNFIRYGLAPLAASIAAGNSVILASSLKSSIASRLQQEVDNYMDSDAIFFVPGVTAADVEIDRVNHISVFGMRHCP